MPYDPNLSKVFTSEFNEAGFQMKRLDSLWVLANNSAINGKHLHWNVILDRIYQEFYADAYKLDSKKYEEEFLKLSKKIEGCKTNIELYAALFEKEKFLRLLELDLGKGTKRKDPEEDGEFD